MNFTEKELQTILMLIELKLDRLEEARSIYVEFGEEMPDFIRSDSEQYCNLRNKIVNYLISLKYKR